ncbi:entry exclusion lipoprotein TrbK [Bartonella rochalimae]|uniref:Entry exclusion lipoprotein TrbK n=1 Tax=Bartonella rochalimae ATCC BAA-1498 TaxID=685782 RepID=E6YLK4_9HYPH|nr:entry exclusion lipoprotein TrbK [Bartonella rochalimae]KEC56751.1 hypothetical protein O99_00173 [Bartonella rochalimae ATCC BAA-1498]CBI77756.1 conserved exported hypothetical protein [Bartonella rochalimae ATCC BAA-1498]
MKSNLLILIMTILTAIALTGCGEERPYPNAENCAPEAFEKAYNSLQSNRNRDAFKAECDAFNEHRRRTEWKFVPSAPKNWLDYDFGTTDYDYETISD